MHMRKLFILLTAVLMAVSVMAQTKAPVVVLKGDPTDYDYFYIAPTSGVTAGGLAYNPFIGLYGDETKTIVPSDVISGCLMKNGYDVVYTVKPEKANKTLVVSYGYVGRQGYNSSIIIQMRNGETQDLVATIDAEGAGSNEAEAIDAAIYNGLRMYHYNVFPKIETEIVENHKSALLVDLTNKTPYRINKATLKLSFYSEGEFIHEQIVTVQAVLYPTDWKRIYIKRDKEARNKKYAIRIEVLNYE